MTRDRSFPVQTARRWESPSRWGQGCGHCCCPPPQQQLSGPTQGGSLLKRSVNCAEVLFSVFKVWYKPVVNTLDITCAGRGTTRGECRYLCRHLMQSQPGPECSHGQSVRWVNVGVLLPPQTFAAATQRNCCPVGG